MLKIDQLLFLEIVNRILSTLLCFVSFSSFLKINFLFTIMTISNIFFSKIYYMLKNLTKNIVLLKAYENKIAIKPKTTVTSD